MKPNSTYTNRRQPDSWNTTSATLDYVGGNHRLVAIGSNVTATVQRDFATNANEQHSLSYNLALLNGGSATVKVQQKVGNTYYDLAGSAQTHTASGTYNFNFTPSEDDIRVVVAGTSRYALTQIFMDRNTIEEVTETYTLSAGGYRYGFQGMEKDDEAKGAGNSYDFGARIYDSRLGRWLTIDPLSRKQPDQSSYKAMLNNPIFWADPDGKTEYETIIINDEKTGSTIKVYRVISPKVKTDGVVCDNHNRDFNHVDYYDYSHVTKITLTAGGNMTVVKSIKILYQNGVKYKDYVSIDQYLGKIPKHGHVINPKDKKIYQAGGFYLTGKDGQGTNYYSKDPDFVGNIDMFLGIMSKYKATGRVKIPKEIRDENGGWDMVETLMKQLEIQAETVDNVLNIVDDIKGKSGSSNEIPGNNNTQANEIIWTIGEDGKYHGSGRNATERDRIVGDTLGSGAEKRDRHVNKSGDTLQGRPKF